MGVAQQLGMDAQVVAQENDVPHHGVEDVGDAARLGVQLHSLRSDGQAGADVAFLDGDRKRLDDLRIMHPGLAQVGAPFHQLPVQPIVFADEVGHEQTGRLVVEHLRRRHLLDFALVHHRHPVGEHHRLPLVVGDIDHGHFQALLQAAYLVLHVLPQAAVQGAQGFVHQHQVRLKHQGAGDRGPLLLAAGHLPRAAVRKLAKLHHVQGPLDAGCDRVLGDAPRLQGKGEVFRYGHVRKQSVLLKNDADVPLVRLHPAHRPAIEEDFPAGGLLKAGQHL